MATKALLEEHGEPSDDQIRDFLSGNLCRCGGYPNIMRAVRAAAARKGGRLTPTRLRSVARASFDFASLRSGRTEQVFTRLVQYRSS